MRTGNSSTPKPFTTKRNGSITLDAATIRETFEIDGHPAAKLCYAFNFVENDVPVVKTVLGVLPADTPQSAVKVAIASKARSK
jgi:hypothetical protein